MNGQDYYGRLCRTVRQWAGQLGTTAEDIEFVLWNQKPPFWDVCEQQHDLALP